MLSINVARISRKFSYNWLFRLERAKWGGFGAFSGGFWQWALDRDVLAGREQEALSPQRRLLMHGFALSQLLLRLLSAVLGGYGIFCLIMSFAVPTLGAQAFLLLAAAAGIVHFSSPRKTPR